MKSSSLTSSLACFELQRIRFADFNNDNCADMYIINQGDGPDSLSLGSFLLLLESPGSHISITDSFPLLFPLQEVRQANLPLSKVQKPQFLLF